MNLMELSKILDVKKINDAMKNDKNGVVRSHCYELLACENVLPDCFVKEDWEVTNSLLRKVDLNGSTAFLICEKLKDNLKWRVRQNVLKTCVEFILKGNLKFLEIYFSFFNDKVDEIRKLAVKSLKYLEFEGLDEKIELILSEVNYKVRLDLVEICIERDKKNGNCKFFKVLIGDNVDLVRIKVLEEIESGFVLDLESREKLEVLKFCGNEDVRVKVEKVLVGCNIKLL
jgi:hypothetical protein